MADAPILGGTTTVALDDERLRRPLQRPARARVRARRAQRAPPGHRRRPRRAATSAAAAPSRGARRAPAAPAPARRARRSGPAAASSSAPSRATTPSRSTARSAAPRCAARCRVHADRGSIAVLDTAGVRHALDQEGRRRCSPTGPRAARCCVVLSEEQANAALSFRNLERVSVLPADERRRRRPDRRRVAARQPGGARRAHRPRQGREEGGRGVVMDPSQVIIRPVVCEKSYVLAAADKYTFRVHPDAHKTQIRQAVEALFDVKVVEVRTASVKSKPKRRGLTAGRTRALEEGDRAGARGRHDPDLPGPAGPRGVLDHADSQAQADQPRPALRRPTRTSPRSRRPSPRRRLVEGLTKSGGRNAHGRKTSRHRGGGAKRLYRKIDFKRRKDGIPAKVAAIEYDPNRTAYIALLHYADGAKGYILAPSRLRVGTTVQSGAGVGDRGRQLPAAGATCRSAPSSTTSSSSPAAAASSARSAGAGDPAHGEGGRHGHAAPALRRDAPGPRRVPRDRRHDRQRRSPERQDRQGRPQASHGRAPADARHGHEPGRPPARRRRGLDDGRSPSGDAVGRADARLPHAQEEQGVRPLHRPWPPPWEGQGR